jgi:hypothetical protein
VDFFKAHVGNVRQLLHEGEDPETASVTPQLKVPEIPDPSTQESKVLHSDVEGSPYSATPGRLTLAEAAEQAASRGGTASKEPAARAEKDKAEAEERSSRSRTEPSTASTSSKKD